KIRSVLERPSVSQPTQSRRVQVMKEAAPRARVCFEKPQTTVPIDGEVDAEFADGTGRPLQPPCDTPCDLLHHLLEALDPLSLAWKGFTQQVRQRHRPTPARKVGHDGSALSG